MTTRLNVLSRTQRLEINCPSDVVVTNAGPVGPPGSSGSSGGVTELQVDAKISEHNTRETPHTNVTSGRDFVALFQNGLV